MHRMVQAIFLYNHKVNKKKRENKKEKLSDDDKQMKIVKELIKDVKLK